MRSSIVSAAFGLGAAVLLFAWAGFAQPTSGAQPTGAANTQAGASAGFSVGFGQGTQPAAQASAGADVGTEQPPEKQNKEKKDTKLAWRGTTLTFGQSATTQTLGVGKDYQSRNSDYSISFAFAPRYYVFDQDDHTININAKAEVYEELTNSDGTTRRREPIFGNIELNGAWGWTVFKNDEGFRTKLTGGPRFVLPTEKFAWRSGHRFTLGLAVGAAQDFPMTGKDATWFPTASVSASLAYMKPLRTATTSENSDFERERRSISGQSIVSNQFGVGAKTNHQLSASLNAMFDVLSQLHLSLGYAWAMQWAYTFDKVKVTSTGVTGAVYEPRHLENATNFRVNPWFVAALDYDLLPEVGLGLGYYNLTSAIGADGQRRNSLWSPDARFYFDVTANLDELYLTISGKRSPKDDDKAAAKAAATRSAQARHNARNQMALTSTSY